MKISLEDLVANLEPESIEGAVDYEIRGIESLEKAMAGQLSFLSSSKYAKQVSDCKASVLLLPIEFQGERPDGQTWIRVKDPSFSLAKVCKLIEDKRTPKIEAFVHPSAVISDSVTMGEGVHVGPNCIIESGSKLGDGVFLQGNIFLGEGVQIGRGSKIYHGVSVNWGCVVGEKCEIHANAVIGGEGFGYHSDANGHHKLPQIGNVVLEDKVEIGANSTVDRARFSSTVIGEGTKVDNLVQVGHNVIIGKHCILCSQSGVAGSGKLEDFVILAGQVGVGGHLTVGAGTTITGQTGVTKDVPPKSILSGTPGMDHKSQMKLQALTKKLPAFQDRIKALEKAIEPKK